MYRCYNCCPCILPPILLFRLFRSVTPIGLSWFKTTPPLPLSLFRFFSLLSLQICLFPSAPIFRFHTSLSLLFFIFCRSFFFQLPFFSSVFLSQTIIAETCFLYFSHNHKRLFLNFLFQRNHLLYTLIFFSNFSLIT